MRANITKELADLRKEIQRRQAGTETLEAVNVLDHIAEVYHPLHADLLAGGHQYYNLPGGRGSCKSSFVSLEIVSRIMADPSGLSNAIVFRRIAGTMRESVYSQISWAIEELGVGHLWRGMVSPMQWEYRPTGAQIIFRGLDDSSKLKSIKPRRGVFRYVWFEEFAELPGPNFQRSVLQSVVRGGNDFAVFRSFNPAQSVNHWANVLIQEPDDKAITLLTNYTMIPEEWLGESFLYEARRLKEVNETLYRHEYLGEATGTGGEVFPNLEIRTITAEEEALLGYRFYGCDFGYAVDPCSFLVCAYDRKHETIYLLDEIYKRGLSNKELAEAIIAKGHNINEKATRYVSYLSGVAEGPSKADIIADCAEPKSIIDLRQCGLKVRPCHKEPGCVMYRVKWLQSRRIVIDPKRTPESYKEFVNYTYKQDKDGNFLSVLPDANNHSIDSLAYALNEMIYTRRGGTA
jgi:PBSX family phage terminase large subunit